MEKADILEMTVSYLQSRCQSKRNLRIVNNTLNSPEIAEARLVSQLSTPYQPHSRPHQNTTTTRLTQLPGTPTMSPEPVMSTPAYFDAAIPLYVDASMAHSPSGSTCSEVSPTCSPGGSTSCSPPTIVQFQRHSNTAYMHASPVAQTLPQSAWRPW